MPTLAFERTAEHRAIVFARNRIAKLSGLDGVPLDEFYARFANTFDTQEQMLRYIQAESIAELCVRIALVKEQL